jgi:hypothetical protein
VEFAAVLNIVAAQRAALFELETEEEQAHFINVEGRLGNENSPDVIRGVARLHLELDDETR